MSEKIAIRVENLTKDYGNKRGIFDVNLQVMSGETVGFIGTNGSGKTTTIRNMMGFVKPDRGNVTIMGMDAWREATDIKNYVSYIPGEIAFPAYPTGTSFLKAQADMLGIRKFDYINYLIKILQLDPTANLKRMSKGMKQKTAIVAALMGDKEILILDEPTTGLDPLMRDAFLDLIREEKKKGRTIFMSSQIIDELEEVCDKVVIINDGYIMGELDTWRFRHEDTKRFIIEFESTADVQKFMAQCNGDFKINEDGRMCMVNVSREEVGRLLSVLRMFNIIALHEKHENLDDAVKGLYLSKTGGKDE